MVRAGGWVRVSIAAGLLVLLLTPGWAVEENVQPGSVLYITVVGHQEFTREVTVHEDGTTDYGVLGNVPVDGMTAGEIRTLLTEVLQHVIEQPVVFVDVSHYAVVEARVTGAVLRSGPIEVRSPADIRTVLASAGGTVDDADLRRIEIHRAGEGVQVVDTLNLIDAAFDPSATRSTYFVRSGDVVLVPQLTESSFVRVIGAVRSPGYYVPDAHSTVLEMIYMAGGPAPNADMGDVQHVARRDGRTTATEFDVPEVSRQGGEFPRVRPGDTIIVSDVKEWERLGFWADFMRNLTLLLSAYVVLTRI